MANNWNNIVCHASGRDDMGSDFGWNLFHAIRSVGKTVNHGLGSVGNQLDKVPVVGKGLHAVYTVATGPVSLSANIASGARIDHAVMNDFKDNLHAAQDLAPYAQTVVSFVPGVGQGVAGAIGAASALSQGKPITEALLTGVKGALPGGPIAKSAFDVAMAAAQGQSIDKIALAGLPIPDDQKKLVFQGLAVVHDVAHGKRLDHIITDQALAALPPEYRKAVTTGIALGHAKNLQDVMKTGAKEAMPEIARLAGSKIANDPTLKAGLDTLTGGAKKGFELGVGMTAHKFSPVELNAIRGNLTPDQKNGLDLALSTHIGKLTKQLPANIDPKVKFGYYASIGMKQAKPENRAAMKAILVKDSKTTRGMVAAKTPPVHLGFWARIKHLITGK